MAEDLRQLIHDRMVLAGVQDGFPPDHGHAWNTLADIIAWVASPGARAREVEP